MFNKFIKTIEQVIKEKQFRNYNLSILNFSCDGANDSGTAIIGNLKDGIFFSVNIPPFSNYKVKAITPVEGFTANYVPFDRHSHVSELGKVKSDSLVTFLNGKLEIS